MYTKLSPDNSEHVFGISAQTIDPVDLHFLQTSRSISRDDFVRLINQTKKMDENMIDHDFSLIEGFGPIKICRMRISDRYFAYFKKNRFLDFDGSIVFCTEASMPTYEKIMVWPLLSENIYLLQKGMLRFEDGLPFYEQTVDLGSKSKDIKCTYVNHDETPYVEKISFSRVYRTGKRRFWSGAVEEVFVSNDLVLYEGWKQSDPSGRWLIKRQAEEPMWLVRHQDEVNFVGPVEFSRCQATGNGGVLEE